MHFLGLLLGRDDNAVGARAGWRRLEGGELVVVKIDGLAVLSVAAAAGHVIKGVGHNGWGGVEGVKEALRHAVAV